MASFESSSSSGIIILRSGVSAAFIRGGARRLINGLCKSMPYSSESRKYNVNTPSKARQITDKVFWDVK